MTGKKRALFDDDDEEQSSSKKESKLEINEAYAKQYEERKTREMLSNKKAFSLFAEDAGSDGEDASSEDEYAEELTPQLDNQIQQTIAMIRNKDPKIYRKDFQPFEHTSKPADKQEKAKKPVLYQDLIREKIKRGEVIDESSSSEDEEEKNKPSYYEEQEKLKREFKMAADDDDGDFVLEMKPKSALSSHDAPPPISKDEEAFLFKYLSDRDQWTANLAPTITASKFDPKKPLLLEDEDEEELERAEEFEQKFVFRHMEPNSTEIVSHGRKIEGSLRRKENTRKQKRDEAEERKRQEAEAKKEELKRLKNLKRKMIEKELLEAFGTVKEDKVLKTFQMEDLDGDFDPAAWDAKMGKVFDEEYYNEEDEEFERELEEQDQVGGYVPEDGVGEEGEENQGEGEEIQGEAEEEPVQPLTKKDLKRMVEERLEKEVEELELENGEQSEFKFHYRQVEPNDYGLDELEVLQATNQELNAFVSLKRMAPYVEKEWFASAQHRKKFRDKIKQRRQEAAQTTSKKEKERLRVAKNRFEKSKEATLLAKDTNKPKSMSSARLKSFGA